MYNKIDDFGIFGLYFLVIVLNIFFNFGFLVDLLGWFMFSFCVIFICFIIYFWGVVIIIILM